MKTIFCFNDQCIDTDCSIRLLEIEVLIDSKGCAKKNLMYDIKLLWHNWQGGDARINQNETI